MKTKVAAGEYATESEVIRDGLRVLMARDRAVENWLRQEVAPAHDALKADPARAVSVDKVRAALAAERKKGHRKSVIQYRVVFAPEAQEQLAALYRYIAAAAVRILRQPAQSSVCVPPPQ